MDQELIAYFDRNFQEVSRQIVGLREEMTQRFEQVDARFEQVDARFDQVDARFEQVDGRFEQVDEAIRHNRVLIEDVRSDLKLLAEGLVSNNECLAAFKEQTVKDLEDIRDLVRRLPFVELGNRIRLLEAWRETKERDPIDIIRERLQNKTL